MSIARHLIGLGAEQASEGLLQENNEETSSSCEYCQGANVRDCYACGGTGGDRAHAAFVECVRGMAVPAGHVADGEEQSTLVDWGDGQQEVYSHFAASHLSRHPLICVGLVLTGGDVQGDRGALPHQGHVVRHMQRVQRNGRTPVPLSGRHAPVCMPGRVAVLIAVVTR